MTNLEAIKILDNLKPGDYSNPYEKGEAIVMAISALQAQEVKIQHSTKDICVLCKDTINRQDAIDSIGKCTDIYVNNLPTMVDKAEAYQALNEVPSAQPEYEELTPEEAASEIASGSIMSASYWLDAMIRLKQMGYAICRKKG